MTTAKANTQTKPAKGKSTYSVRGNELVGRVISAKAPKTVTVEREIVIYVPKFERYMKTRSRVKAHNPEWINAKVDDIVKIGETRKISKTKNFIITQIMGHTRHIRTRDEMKEGMKVSAEKTATKEGVETQ